MRPAVVVVVFCGGASSVPCDVFTLTALLDVLGRAHDAEPFWVFRRMKDPRCTDSR